MSEPHEDQSEDRSQQRGLGVAHERITEADEILAGLPDDLGGRLKTARRLLRTLGRLLDEAGTPSIRDHAHSDECTNRELRAVRRADGSNCAFCARGSRHGQFNLAALGQVDRLHGC